MYLRILKKDLKRKKTMNLILLIFIILAATFIASSANNMLSTTTALDEYFKMADVPDYEAAATDKSVIDKLTKLSEENGYGYDINICVQIDPKNVYIDGKQLEYSNSNTFMLSSLENRAKIFGSNDKEITEINDGEIYIISTVYHNSGNNFEPGSKVRITANDVTKTFTVVDYTKDAKYGSPMMGVTRFFISENDLAEFMTEESSKIYQFYIYTDDEGFDNKYYDLDIPVLFIVNKDGIKLMYVMDLVIAAIILVVSVCLILISIVILRFTINFTISEDFREIGVMKAIGLKNGNIQTLYTVKYLAISIVGASIGFLLSIPFGEMLTRKVARNIIISGRGDVLPNLICAALTAGTVILFCRLSTRKIKRLSPIDAVRNGQSGERFSRKSVINLSRSKMSAVPFMAVNDIFSGIKRFITMIIIFALGLLLIIIPANTVNTLKSDHLILWFNMAECDHVIATEILANNLSEADERVQSVRDFLSGKNIPADVFQEDAYRMNASYNGKRTSSLAFQGMGDIDDSRYAYTEGTPPQNENEIAVTALIADRIGADIGDEIEVSYGDYSDKYIITALFQSMNNMGEGMRFYHGKELDRSCLMGSFGIQIKYTDDPDSKALEERKALLKEKFPGLDISTAGEYVNNMIGDVAGQMDSISGLILFIVICTNVLVTVLMVKSFITKEKSEIALLKAIGFKNSWIVAWQSIRIGIVIFIAVILAVIFSTPLSQLIISPLFKMMGAQSIDFVIKPLEVFVLYPLIIFAATVISAIFTAMQAGTIKASETANIE